MYEQSSDENNISPRVYVSGKVHRPPRPCRSGRSVPPVGRSPPFPNRDHDTHLRYTQTGHRILAGASGGVDVVPDGNVTSRSPTRTQRPIETQLQEGEWTSLEFRYSLQRPFEHDTFRRDKDPSASTRTKDPNVNCEPDPERLCSLESLTRTPTQYPESWDDSL